MCEFFFSLHRAFKKNSECSGRILAEVKIQPPVIPIWLTGFDQLMPEGRPFPYKFLPRRGTHLSIHFGDPIPVEEIKKSLVKEGSSLDKIRIELTELVQQGVESLGHKISGSLLNKR
jgi:monolysocardiolipin acyltransferase